MNELAYWKRRFEERNLTVNELAGRIKELERELHETRTLLEDKLDDT